MHCLLASYIIPDRAQEHGCSGSCMVQCSEKCSMKIAARTMQRLLHGAMQRKMQHEKCSMNNAAAPA